MIKVIILSMKSTSDVDTINWPRNDAFVIYDKYGVSIGVTKWILSTKLVPKKKETCKIILQCIECFLLNKKPC